MEQTYPCTKCKRGVPSEALKYSQNGKIVCIHCYNKEKATQSAPIEKFKREVNRSQGVMNYICSKCKYTFKRGINSRFSSVCPYCGGNNILEYREKTSEDMLREEIEFI